MSSSFDVPDAALLVRVARFDRDALGELFRRHGTAVLVAAGWSIQRADDAERRAVEIFLDVWARPEIYAPGADRPART